MYTIAEMIEGLKAGNESVWRSFIDEYKNKIFKTALSYIPFEDEAEDLTQEVFMEIYKSIGNFRAESSLSTWIYRITINKAINHLSKNKKHHTTRPIEDFVVAERQSGGESTDASSMIQQKEYRKIIQNAISQLPERQAKAFVLHKIDGRSYKEISEILDISLASVESLIHRAKSGLQKKLINIYTQLEDHR
jgi:RNA polymerase sigma-70 factor, ECF subfamily